MQASGSRRRHRMLFLAALLLTERGGCATVGGPIEGALQPVPSLHGSGERAPEQLPLEAVLPSQQPSRHGRKGMWCHGGRRSRRRLRCYSNSSNREGGTTS